MSDFDPERPVCRQGIKVTALANDMVYIRHPEFSSRIIKREFWAFLEMCRGLNLEELSTEIRKKLGFQVSVEQTRATVQSFIASGVFEGTRENERHYRVFDASRMSAFIAPVIRRLETRWFAVVTTVALAACLALLFNDWNRFISLVVRASQQHPIATVLLYYVAFIPVALLHELGHAVVIRYHGGEVPEVVIRRNAHFAVLSNTTVLKEQSTRLWYLSMGTVVDVYIWLFLLAVFHFSDSYLVLAFLLPQTIYFLLYSYSIFKNSDFLKTIATWLGQQIPPNPASFIREGWRKLPDNGGARRLLYLMTVSLILKLFVTMFLIVTFAFRGYQVLVLYAVYRALLYLILDSRFLKLLKRESPA